MMIFPEIDPIAFSIGPFVVRWYALAYLAGFILGWKYILYLSGLDKDKGEIKIKTIYGAPVTKADVDDFLAWCIMGVILGGRLGYVAFYQPQMILQDPLEILKVWHGGMSFHGGTLGVIAVIIIFSLRRHLPLLHFADLICCAVPIGLFFGRIANFINGELFGRVTTSPLGMVFPHGGNFPRHPSQIYEALLEGALLFVILFILVHRPFIRHKAGMLSGLFLTGYALARMVAELFREPDIHIGFIAGSLTMGQILSVPMMLAGLGLMVFSCKRKSM